jgi:acetone monooxygenase
MDLYANGALPTNPTPDAEKLDALIIGAGVAGLYQLHLLRNQGLKVRAYDSASDTWDSRRTTPSRPRCTSPLS